MFIDEFMLQNITLISSIGSNAFAGTIVSDKAGCSYAKICLLQIQKETGSTKCNEDTSDPQLDLLTWKKWISSSLIPSSLMLLGCF
jgi:hypothetical protein